ncbi:MAG: hypothetical protein U5J83_02680 [Bryobacterales bacterium]|nr:hypothetical protein [Bryobacterales bacterium]
MTKRPKPKIYMPGPWRRLWEQWRGEEVRVFESGRPLPVLVVRHPRSKAGAGAAESLRTAWCQLLTVMEPDPLQVYAEVLRALPAMVVVRLQERNPGGVLGHATPRGLESAATRRLEAETGSIVGEVDLAFKLIAAWQPRPLAALASGPAAMADGDLQYRVALLSVLFHELEHLAFPDRQEREVRQRSDAFYAAALAAGVRGAGSRFGLDG